MGEAKRRRDAGLMPQGPKPPKFDLHAAMIAMASVMGQNPTTPVRPIRKPVIEFCLGISSETPIFLPMTMVSPDYAAGWCHNNVLEQVRRAGGDRVNGWMIWDAGRYVEAEFHSVWRDAEGNLIDLTPRLDGEAEVLFLPDTATKIKRDGSYDLFPNNRTSIPEVPYTHASIPMAEPYSRRLIQIDNSPFGFSTLS